MDEKSNRADTPSTEDDNTRDVEPPPPVKRGRGRHPRAESATYSDSVPSSPASSSVGHDDEKEHKAWKKSIMLVYNRIAAHKNASIFLKPITDDKAPNYTSLIYRFCHLSRFSKLFCNVLNFTFAYSFFFFFFFYFQTTRSSDH